MFHRHAHAEIKQLQCVRKQVQHSTQTSDIIFETSDTENLLDKLQVNFAFDKFVSILKEHEQIDKFVKTVNAIRPVIYVLQTYVGKPHLTWEHFSVANQQLRWNTTRNGLNFVRLFYHMFGGGVINALRGRGHFSQVTGNKAQKGKFPPSSGEYNFPIPSVPTLINIGFPSVCLKQVQHSTQTSDIIFETSDTENLLDKLQVNFAFDKFVSILKEHEQIDKFVKTVNAIRPVIYVLQTYVGKPHLTWEHFSVANQQLRWNTTRNGLNFVRLFIICSVEEL